MGAYEKSPGVKMDEVLVELSHPVFSAIFLNIVLTIEKNASYINQAATPSPHHQPFSVVYRKDKPSFRTIF